MAQKRIFTAKMGDIEAGAYHTAAEVLLIGLRHIKGHNVSYPMGMTPKRWQKIVDELIWFCEYINSDRPDYDKETRERLLKAQKLLGKHFMEIWC